MATDLEQAHFRFRTDGDAADATPTWGDDEDTNYDPGALGFRLRMGLANLGDASSGSLALYLKKNAGSYAAITTASTGGVKSYDASSDADDTPIRIPRLSMSAEWRLPGAAIDLDFAGNRIYPSGAFTDYFSCSRASDGYAKNSSGDWVQFSSNVLRITDLGLLHEDVRTNYLLNSGTPATQETGSLTTGDYILWVEGSGSAIASNGTGTVTGAESATEGSASIFTVSVAGTINITVTGTLDRFQLEKASFNNYSPTSYIPTGATTAARAGDGISCIGALATVLETLPQSVVADVKTDAHWPGVPNWGIVADSGINITLLSAYGEHNTQFVGLFNGINPSLTPVLGNSLTLSGGAKIAVAQATASRSAVGGGGTVASDTNTAVAMTNPAIGNCFNQIMFGRIRRLTVWNSKLSDATLQALTAP